VILPDRSVPDPSEEADPLFPGPLEKGDQFVSDPSEEGDTHCEAAVIWKNTT
jgi:hypothetical protein